MNFETRSEKIEEHIKALQDLTDGYLTITCIPMMVDKESDTVNVAFCAASALSQMAKDDPTMNLALDLFQASAQVMSQHMKSKDKGDFGNNGHSTKKLIASTISALVNYKSEHTRPQKLIQAVRAVSEGKEALVKAAFELVISRFKGDEMPSEEDIKAQVIKELGFNVDLKLVRVGSEEEMDELAKKLEEKPFGKKPTANDSEY
ncbi:MAG: hypothetical protein RPR28_07780 [Cycloclasticus sp.]